MAVAVAALAAVTLSFARLVEGRLRGLGYGIYLEVWRGEASDLVYFEDDG